jgi:hypothetical protein
MSYVTAVGMTSPDSEWLFLISACSYHTSRAYLGLRSESGITIVAR